MTNIPLSPAFFLAKARSLYAEMRYHEEQTHTQQSIEDFFSRDNPEYDFIKLDPPRTNWRFNNEESNFGFGKIQLISVPFSLAEDNIEQAGIKIGYVRSQDQLFYVNAIDKIFTPIVISKEALDEFDRQLQPTQEQKYLSEAEQQKILAITGHSRQHDNNTLSENEITLFMAFASSLGAVELGKSFQQGGFLKFINLFGGLWPQSFGLPPKKENPPLLITRNSDGVAITFNERWWSGEPINDVPAKIGPPILNFQYNFTIKKNTQDQKFHAEISPNYTYEINDDIWKKEILPSATRRLNETTKLTETDLFDFIPCLCDDNFTRVFAERFAKETDINFVQRARELINLCFKDRPNDLSRIQDTIRTADYNIKEKVDLLISECDKHKKYLSKFKDATRVKQHAIVNNLFICLQNDQSITSYGKLLRFAEIFANNHYILQKDADSRGIRFLKTVGNILAGLTILPAALMAIYKGTPKFWKSREDIFYSDVKKHIPVHEEKFKFVLSKDELIDKINDPQSTYALKRFAANLQSIRHNFFEPGEGDIFQVQNDFYKRRFLFNGKLYLGDDPNSLSNPEKTKRLLTALFPAPFNTENDIENFIKGNSQGIGSPIPDLLGIATHDFNVRYSVFNTEKGREDNRIISVITQNNNVYTKAHYDRFPLRDKEGIVIGFLEGTTEANYQLTQKEITRLVDDEEKKELVWGFDLINFKTNNEIVHKVLQGKEISENELKKTMRPVDPIRYIQDNLEHYVTILQKLYDHSNSEQAQNNILSLNQLKLIIDDESLPQTDKFKQFSTALADIRSSVQQESEPLLYMQEALNKLASIELPIPDISNAPSEDHLKKISEPHQIQTSPTLENSANISAKQIFSAKQTVLDFSTPPDSSTIQHQKRGDWSRSLNQVGINSDALQQLNIILSKAGLFFSKLSIDDQNSHLANLVEENVINPIITLDRNGKAVLTESAKKFFNTSTRKHITNIIRSLYELVFSSIFEKNGAFNADLKQYIQKYFGVDIDAIFKNEKDPNKIHDLRREFFNASFQIFTGELLKNKDESVVLWATLLQFSLPLSSQYLKIKFESMTKKSLLNECEKYKQNLINILKNRIDLQPSLMAPTTYKSSLNERYREMRTNNLFRKLKAAKTDNISKLINKNKEIINAWGKDDPEITLAITNLEKIDNLSKNLNKQIPLDQSLKEFHTNFEQNKHEFEKDLSGQEFIRNIDSFFNNLKFPPSPAQSENHDILPSTADDLVTNLTPPSVTNLTATTGASPLNGLHTDINESLSTDFATSEILSPNLTALTFIFNRFQDTYQKLATKLADSHGINIEHVEAPAIDFQNTNSETLKTINHYREMALEALSKAVENNLDIEEEPEQILTRKGKSETDATIKALEHTMGYMKQINEAVEEQQNKIIPIPTLSTLEPMPDNAPIMIPKPAATPPAPRSESPEEIISVLESKPQEKLISYHYIQHPANDYQQKLKEARKELNLSANLESGGNLNAGQPVSSDIVNATQSRLGKIDGGAVIFERLDKHQIRSELLALPDALSPVHLWEQNTKKDNLKNAEKFPDDFLKNMFTVISKEAKSHGRDITEQDIQKYLKNKNMPHPNNNATILFKAYNTAYQKAIYNDSKDKFPSNELIKIAIRQVESRRELDTTPIVIKEAFSPAYAEAILLYCRAKNYEVHQSQSFGKLFDNKISQKKIDKFKKLLTDQVSGLEYSPQQTNSTATIKPKHS